MASLRTSAAQVSTERVVQKRRWLRVFQAATTSGKPVLFSMDDDAGHGGPASTRNQRQGNMADAMAFALWQFGVPEFQPTAGPAVVGASAP